MATESEFESPEPGFLDRWLAPLILCGIAITQIVLAHSTELSPWKGGGFGMFASVDSPSTRVINAEGLDLAGNAVRIDVFEMMSEAESLRWSSWPDPEFLEVLADRMEATEFVAEGSQRGQALERFREENPGLDLPSVGDGGNWMRPRRAGDRDGDGGRLRAVRVGAWQIRYEAGENRIVTEALGEMVERGEWP